MIRASNSDTATGKLQQHLETYALWHHTYRTRIVPIVGDLAQPRLGLTDAQFTTLAHTIDSIYHNGALVHFTYPYEQLKAPNVLGTREILRLACMGHAKPLHYVSTISVFPNRDQIVSEQTALDHNGELPGGYAQSKWVAETLVQMAHTRGLPVCVYRPGYITGHSQTGTANTDDMMCRLIKGCIQLGCVPDLDIVVDMTPVDYVSQAIVTLAQKPTVWGQTFHLVNPHRLPLHELATMIRESGYPLQQVTYAQWQEELIRAAQDLPSHALYPFLPLFLAQHASGQTRLQATPLLINAAQFDCQETLKALHGTRVTCPPGDMQLLRTYFDYFVRTGFLEPPIQTITREV